MLSAKYTLMDVKDLIGYPYSKYCFDTNDAYERILKKLAEMTKLDYLLPSISDNTYAAIAAKDKGEVSALTEAEQYIYWAEVNLICCDFMDYMAKKYVQRLSGSSHSFSAEGTSFSASGKDPGYNSAAIGFYQKGSSFLARAGYSINRLQRGGRFWSEDTVYAEGMIL